MNSQTLTSPVMLCSSAKYEFFPERGLESALLKIRRLKSALRGTHDLQACSRDYGFDIDEEMLAEELLASLPASQSVAIDEIAASSLYFLS